MKAESAKVFRKRLTRGPKVYALVEVNSLLSQGSKDRNLGLPEALKGYIDIFSP